jgi:hypothetical protein
MNYVGPVESHCKSCMFDSTYNLYKRNTVFKKCHADSNIGESASLAGVAIRRLRWTMATWTHPKADTIFVLE